MFQTHGFFQHAEHTVSSLFWFIFELARFEWRRERVSVEWDRIQRTVARFAPGQVFADERGAII